MSKLLNAQNEGFKSEIIHSCLSEEEKRKAVKKIDACQSMDISLNEMTNNLKGGALRV